MKNQHLMWTELSDFNSVKVGFSLILPLASLTFYLIEFIYTFLEISVFNDMA